MSQRVFLSAGWHNLLLFNYSVPAEKLKPYMPPDVELDLRDGSAHLSLVAFQFLRTKVLGIPWPGFVNFTEVNLRFYIRHKGERGVCFVREYVPSPIVAWIARATYNEPYKSAAMYERIERTNGTISAEYNLRDGENKMRFYAKAEKKPFMPPEDSLEHYFKEHELGVGRDRQGRLVTYRVHHPHWEIYPLLESSIEVDAGLYGPDFAFLGSQRPDSAVFALGSDIKVFHKA